MPDPAIEGGMPLPIRMAAEFPPELVATPIEDIDNFYADKKVRVLCPMEMSRNWKELFFVFVDSIVQFMLKLANGEVFKLHFS